jgi:maleate cis-trans isomerase
LEGKIIKAVIFDMDGVLIDAKEWHYEALNRALRLFGFEIARYAHLTSYDGLPTRKKLEMLTIEQGLPPALHAFINQMKQQYTMEMIYTHCKPLFAHEYALSRLKTRGLRLACCSNSIRATVDAMLDQAARAIEDNRWDGVIVSGGPREVLNPGFYQRLCAELTVPVATALRSSAAALKVFGVKRALLMTPVDDQLKDLYRDYLANFGIEAVYPAQTLRAHTDAQKLSSADVASMTDNCFRAQPGADGVYFQGALLDPLKVLDKLEFELKVPVVASNPAMLWFVLSKLGLRYEIAGYGRLLAAWPQLPILQAV